MKNINDFKFDIIILAGQSNAEGSGIRNDMSERNEKIYHLIDVNPVSVYDNSQGETVLDITLPIKTAVEIACERKWGDKYCADLSKSFAQEYIKDGRLSSDRKILVVKAAVGGTGFAKKQWGVGNPLSDRLFVMADKALSLNSANRIVAFLWHQGEHDAWENANLNAKERYDFYRKNFTEQMLLIRKRYGTFDFPIIAGEFVPTWVWGLENKEKIEAVYKATKDALTHLGNAGFVSSEGLKSNNEAIGNGDDVHFCQQSLDELGKRYYERYKTLLCRR